MSRRRRETPLVPASGASARLLAFAAAAMSFLAVCAVAAGLAAGHLAQNWSEDLAQTATVKIDAPKEQMDTAVAAALSVLESTPGVAGARALSDDEIAALLAPWLGADAPVDALPTPAVIDVLLTNGGPDVEGLRLDLEAAVPGASYDDHKQWRAPLLAAATGLRRLAIAALIIVAATAAAIVALACRASLAANRAVVEALQLVGAEDAYIARAFERRFATRALVGGIVGFALAAIGLATLPHIGGQTTTSGGFGLDLTPDGWDWAILASTPLLFAVITLATTRLSVLNALHRDG